MTVSPSTVRAELAELERLGLLTHPHTSAGRVPTEAGYRFYADSLLERLEPRPSPFPLDLAAARSELESALQETTESLSQATRLLALVSAPPLQTATVRHIEVLVLQPQVLMVVMITSTGGVSKRLFALAEPVDAGLALWAGEYLNEQLAGLELGSAVFRRRFEDPALSAREREFLELLRPAFTELAGEDEQRLFVGGAASLLGDVRSDELEACQRLLEALEKRARDPRDARRDARNAEAVRPGRRRARESRAPGRRSRRRVVRALDAHARRGQPPRAAAHGLREGDPLRARGRARALALRRVRLRRRLGPSLP